jgi:hypothetical protein
MSKDFSDPRGKEKYSPETEKDKELSRQGHNVASFQIFFRTEQIAFSLFSPGPFDPYKGPGGFPTASNTE